MKVPEQLDDVLPELFVFCLGLVEKHFLPTEFLSCTVQLISSWSYCMNLILHRFFVHPSWGAEVVSKIC